MQRTVLALCLTIAFTNPNVNAIAVAEAPAQTVQALLAEARDAQSRRDFSAAAESYRKAVELDPSVPELWANLGLMYHESGKPDEAIRSFKEAIRLNPSLFVPQLFMGIELLGTKNPEAAIPFLESAEQLNPNDLQVALNLGKAYSLLNHGDHAAEAYSIATRLAPNDGNIWLSLGTAYLQQVESDARLMTSAYSHSAYVTLRAAETFAEEGKLVQAEDAYRAAIASGSPAACTHAEFGITLLREKKVAEARDQFELETRAGFHCGLAVLGLAVAELAEGRPDVALARLTSISMADPGFVESSLPLFRDAVSADQARPLIDLSRAQQNDDRALVEIGSLIAKTFVSDVAPAQMEFSDAGQPSGIRTPVAANAERLFATGRYSQCSDALKPALGAIGSTQLQLLASCSFYTGDFRTTSSAAQRLKTNTATRAQGLYWESKADQKLAIAALIRAGEIDADSPRMHVLLGDIFRQKRRWDDAEAEYRKAVALDPKSHAARLSLAIVLFSELKTDESLDIDRNLLAEDPNDPEANLLAGEILVQRNLFADAEPYLSKCQNLKPEFVPRLHALLGKVYAETDRIPAAISEYKAGLSADGDGSIHFQLARLYQKSGDKSAAEEAFRESKRLRRLWDERAHIALEQSFTDLSRQ
jgi:tetratricopeptide (TPR) repeat protein